MNRKTRRFLCIVSLMLISLPMAGAQSEAIALRLDEAISESITNNPSVKEARLEWLIRQSQERAAWGDFEPAIVSSVSNSGLDRLNSAAQQVSQFGRTQYSEDKAALDLSLEGRFFSGATYHLGYTLSKTESDFITGSEYESNLSANVEQPLLKGLTHLAPLAGVRAARADELIAFHTYRKQLISVVASIESAYWDLTLAQEQSRISEDAVRIASNIAQDSEERVGVGKMSDLDLLEARTRLDAALADQKEKEQAVIEAALRLRLILSSQRMLTASEVSASEPLVLEDWDAVQFLSSQDELVAKAFAFQPDIAIKQAELDKEQIQLDYRRDQRLPELNARASYGFQGLGATVDESLQRINGQAFPNWTLGLELRIPVLGDIRGGNSVEESLLRKQLLESQLQTARHETEMAVKALIQRVLAYAKQRDASGEVSAYRKQLLDEELLRFDAGKSDIRKLSELEAGLSDALSSEMESHNRFRKALSDLEATSGTNLSSRGLETLEKGRFIFLDALL